MSKPSLETNLVTPVQSFTVPYPVDHLVASPGERYLVATSPEATVVLVLSEAGQRHELELPRPTSSLCTSIDSTGSLLAFVNADDSQLQVRYLKSGQQVTVQHHSEVVDVRFDGQGRLWTIRRGAERFVVELRAAESWEVIADSEFSDDYFREGGAWLRSSSSGEGMFVAAYSGQSEMENYLCEVKHGSLLTRHIQAMDGDQFIFPAPDNATALTLDHEVCEIACYSSPYSTAIARLPWPDYEECENERPGYYGCYLDGDHFLAGSSEGRLFLIQLAPLQIKKEIQVAGHVPVPASIKYPSLADAFGLVSDLTVFGRCGDSVVAFFARDHRSPCPQLVILPIPDLIQG